MKQRTISSIAVVIVGLLAAIVGGGVFAIVFAGTCILALRELRPLIRASSEVLWSTASGIIIGAAALPFLVDDDLGFAIVVACAVGVPMVTAIFLPGDRLIVEWSAVTTGSLYLALPVFAAISMRGQTGGERADWIDNLASAVPVVSPDASGRGLSLLLLALVITWMTDTGAYLVGRRFGRHPLYPRVSPNKTIEGAAGGLLAGAFSCLLLSMMFGLGLHPLVAVSAGLMLAGLALLGDLAESMLKRQGGVKDSGALIPGHGGVLDRIDSLVFVIVGTWLLIGIPTT